MNVVGSNEKQIETDCSPDGNNLNKAAESRNILLREVWSNYKFRATLASLTLYRLPDSALYFLSNFERILSDNYLATSEDIIRMRRATTGIQVWNKLTLPMQLLKYRVKWKLAYHEFILILSCPNVCDCDMYFRKLCYNLARSTFDLLMLEVRDRKGENGFIALKISLQSSSLHHLQNTTCAWSKTLKLID